MSIQPAAEAERDLRSRADSRRAVTWRSILAGLIGVVIICGLASYNDYAMANTFLVGNYLPLGLVVLSLALVLLINAPLLALAPRAALSRGELAVAMMMTLVACFFPTSGFMRYVPASIVGLHYAAADARNAQLLREARLADWILPQFENQDPRARANEPLVRNYFTRNPDVSTEPWGDAWASPPLSWVRPIVQPLWRPVEAVPWGVWLRPALAWGALAAALVGACMCLSFIVHHQWARNERLSFPLAGVYLSLIEPPEKGRVFNATFRSWAFWIAVISVFGVHSFNALSEYNPRIPRIPLGPHLDPILTEQPLNQASWFIKNPQRLYFTIVGVCFFLQSNVALSLWAFVWLFEIVGIAGRSANVELLPDPAQVDQNIGSMAAFGLMLLWIGRAHWWMVIRHMVGVRRGGEHVGDLLSYRLSGWGLVLCVGGMAAWFYFAGTRLDVAVWITFFILLCHLLLSRVVAETGLVFVQLRGWLTRPLQWLLLWSPEEAPLRVDTRSAFMAAWSNQTLSHDLREGAMPYLLHATRVGDEVLPPSNAGGGRSRLAFVGALLLAMFVAYWVSGASMLITEYNFASSVGPAGASPINEYAVVGSTNGTLIFARDYSTIVPAETHNQPLHVAIGAGLTGFLSVMRLQFAWWPLHPVGVLLVFSYPMRMIWFSVFVGWLIKALLVKFGGAPMLRSARPFFVGLIVGEASVAGFWLLMSIILNLIGFEYRPVSLLPS